MAIRFKQVMGMIMDGVSPDQLPGSMKELHEFQQVRLIGYWLERIRSRSASDARGKGKDAYVLQAVYQYQNKRYAVNFGEEQEEGVGLFLLKEMAANHNVPLGDKLVFWGLGSIQWTLQDIEHPVLATFRQQHLKLQAFESQPLLWLGEKNVM